MRLLSIVDALGDEMVFNPDRLIAITKGTFSRGSKDYPVWDLWVDGIHIRVLQSLYTLEGIRKALKSPNETWVPQHVNEATNKQNIWTFPLFIKRYDFKYKELKEDAKEWVHYEEICYFMDGDPLEATGLKMPYEMPKLLIDTYSFDNPTRNLSWIEIDGHTALLFNNRAKS